ncbi:RNA methyltransferase [Maricaulaceae bacterium NA33B04]|nr:RNA methyltransferase [Maricaulaceae bacterium NA33B04]
MAPPRRNTEKRQGAARRAARPSSANEGWIWGRHAVLAALANPGRKVLDLQVTRNASTELPETARKRARIVLPAEISARLPEASVHQGFALKALALEPESLNAVATNTHGLLVVLDQITDPQNVGAVFRSAAAFGARAVIMQDRKAPPLFGTVCKASVGCVETVPHVRVTNIADTLDALTKEGRYAIGLAGEADASLAAEVQANAGPGLVLVLGAEGPGLRPRVAEHCSALARIPMGPKAESLNVAAAAAIALYEASRFDPRINPA